MLFEKLNPKERSALIAAAELTKRGSGRSGETGRRREEAGARSEESQAAKASQLYALLSKTPGEQVLYLAVYSTQRIVHDRIRNYFQKYLPAALEVTNEVVAATGVAPGTPKFQRVKDEMIVTRLDARPEESGAAARAASASAAHVWFCARIGDAAGAIVTMAVRLSQFSVGTFSA